MATAILPCPLCGYHAADLPCPHCASTSFEASLADVPRRAWGSWIDGLRALPQGVVQIATSPRVWPLLIPPVLITAFLFGSMLVWGWTRVERFVEAVRAQNVESLGLEPGWLQSVLAWLMAQGVIVALAQGGSVLILLVVSWVLALWTFSIVYEAIAGPFLDEVQGRIETRWFGKDPYKSIERPAGSASESHATWMSLGAGAVSVACIVVGTWIATTAPWLWFVAAPLSFVLAGLIDRPYGTWLAWALRSQLRSIGVSLKASLLAGLLLVCFFWLKFVPVVGVVCFAGIAGFSTAISLLDIPFSRRRWSFGQRISFLATHIVPVTLFGVSASLFFIVPILGPLCGVPSASLGGQWLVCRLDKTRLRPSHTRVRTREVT